MGLITMLLLFVLLGGVAVVVERRIRARRRLQMLNTDKRMSAFRKWAERSASLNPLHRQWVANLSAEAIQALVGRIDDFCTDLGLRLEWLVSQNEKGENPLLPLVNRIVGNYVDACYQAHQAQDDVLAFEVWQAYIEQPFEKDHQSLAQRLLVHLIDAGISPPAASSLLTTSDKERDVYIHYAVREASEKHPAAFRSVFKSVITSTDAAPSVANPVHA